jgi:hypothetical protein
VLLLVVDELCLQFSNNSIILPSLFPKKQDPLIIFLPLGPLKLEKGQIVGICLKTLLTFCRNAFLEDLLDVPVVGLAETIRKLDFGLGNRRGLSIHRMSGSFRLFVPFLRFEEPVVAVSCLEFVQVFLQSVLDFFRNLIEKPAYSFVHLAQFT